MKKLLSILIASVMMLTMALPAFASNDGYPNDVEEYYNLDFAKYDGTKTAGEFVSENSRLVHQFGTLSDTYDEAMGHKVLKIEGTDAQYGARLTFESNYTNKDFVEGDKFFIEFNFMAVDKYVNNDKLPLLMMNGKDLIRTRRNLADWIELYGAATYRTEFAVNEWNHLVLEIAPGATEGVATVYVNGTAVGSQSYKEFTLDYFNGDKFGSSRFNVGAGYTVLMSKIRSWKSTSSYNAAEAGDTVSIASNNAAVTIGDGVISCATDMTVADFAGKLTLTGTLAVVAADGRVLSDTDKVSSASKVYVRSNSGEVVKDYFIDAFAEGVYFDLDFDKYDGSAVGTFLTRKFNNKVTSINTTEVVADADKGHKVLKYTSTPGVWAGIDMNKNGSFATDVVAGDKVLLETSFKSDDYGGNTKYAIVQFFGSPTTGANLIWIEGTTMTLPSGATTTIKLGEWIHLVLEMTPAETGSGKVITYINGKKVDEFNHSTCTLAYFTNTTWKYNKFQVLNGGYSTLMDNFKAWKSTQSYDAAAEGDTAEITAKNTNVVVKDGVVEYMNASTIADINNSLTAENDATIVYFDNSGAEINDLTRPAATAVRMVVRSASCDVVKAYAMVSTVIGSPVYTIDNGIISGVLGYTTPEILKANLIAADGYTAEVNSTGKYIDENATVTVGGNTYKIDIDDAFTTNIEDTIQSVSLASAGNVQFTTALDDLKGAARKITMSDAAAGDSKTLQARLTPSADYTAPLNVGEVKNIEFSIKADDYIQAVLLIDDQQAIRMEPDGYVYYGDAGAKYRTTLAKYTPNEWLHIAVSVTRVNDSDECLRLNMYIDGELVLKEIPNYYYQGTRTRLDISAPDNGAVTNVYLDDCRVYRAAQQIFDAETMYGSTAPVTAYPVVNGTIFVPYDVLEGDFDVTFNSVLDENGDEFAADYADGTVVYSVDSTRTIIKKYTFTYGELGIRLVDGKVSADVRMLDANETPVLYIAGYADGAQPTCESVTVVNTTDENGMLSASLASGAKYKAFLWNNGMRPYVSAKNYVMENGVWIEK